ncbi:MAG TPA: MtrB/PioB family decaheme-associated outer membrane protein [Usitatibacter sp.]|nr:MtrB/PioB family decaheme-associated outer membrane protein [Usitatibacter sp.]
MRINKQGFAARCLEASVKAALAAMVCAPAAYAADDAVLDLTVPKSVVEIGAGYVSDGSFKFGEYNGLEKKGGFANGNFDLRGGAYGSDTDPTRWRVTGTNLGLETRSLTGQYGAQGRLRIDLGYDELLRNRSDTYQTPYQGAGSSTFTLPSTWLVPKVPQVSSSAGNFRALSPATGLAPALVAGVATPPTAAQAAAVNGIIAADVPLFQNVDLHTKRTRYDGGVSYFVTPQWELKASYSHEDKDGYKPMNFLSLALGTSAVTLPDPIDQTHDQLNASANYTGKQVFFTAAYYGSIFRNNVNSVTWQNPFDPTKSSTFSSAPDNQFHQILLTGGYRFSPLTRLVVNGSYGRATQNEQFVVGPESAFGLPATSLNGRVDTTSFGAKLTSRPMKDLNVWAGYKFDDRDNHTPVNIYRFYDAGEAPTGSSPFNAYFGLPAATMGSNINIYSNRPYSKRSNQVNAEADYQFVKGQWIKFGYDFQKIDRNCNGTWIDCVDADHTRENGVRAEWRAKPLETLSARAGYTYSQRRVDYNDNGWLALVPMAGQVPSGGATQGVADFLRASGLGGFGPLAPWVALQPGNLGTFFPNNSALPQQFYGSRNDIHELPGMRRFFMADRNRGKVRSQLDWQASDKVSITGGLDYNKDDYSNSVFGLQDARSWVANLEASLTVDERTSANAFFTHEDQRSRSAGWSYSSGAISNAATVGGVAGNTVVSGGCFSTVVDRNSNAKIDPCLMWSSDMRDKVETAGVGMRRKGLLGGRVDLGADLVYTKSRTHIGMKGGTYANNPAAVANKPAVNPAVFFIPAADLPEVGTELTELRLNARYALNKASTVRVLYWFQRLHVADFAYDGMQYGTLSGIIPTNEQAPNYRVHIVGVSYQYSFR